MKAQLMGVLAVLFTATNVFPAASEVAKDK